jgi:hypothetical protein
MWITKLAPDQPGGSAPYAGRYLSERRMSLIRHRMFHNRPNDRGNLFFAPWLQRNPAFRGSRRGIGAAIANARVMVAKNRQDRWADAGLHTRETCRFAMGRGSICG